MTYGVLTVCLNSAKTIARTIDSVLAQTMRPAQYVFVDGGSRDGTVEIISERMKSAEQAGQGVPYIIVEQSSKGGISEAWNLGLQVFEPDIVFILNSDDYYEAGAAEQIISVFEENRAVEIVTAAGRYFSEDGKLSFVCRNRPFLLLPMAMTVIHPACFVKKSVYDRVGGFDVRQRVLGDYEFIYRCRKHGVRFHNLRRVMTNVQLGGFSEKNRKLARREMWEIGKKYATLKILPRLAFLARTILGR